MTRKKIMLIATSASLVLLLVVGATLAYLTDMQSVLNVLGIGDDDGPGPGDNNVWIRIDETEFAKIATEQADGSWKIPNLLPGDVVDKDPVVYNGGIEAYVRVKLTDNQGVALSAAYLQELGIVIEDDWGTIKSDGYYYYKTSVASKTSTTAVFKNKAFYQKDGTTKVGDGTIQIPLNWGNEKIGSEFIQVHAEAIQAQNFTPNADGTWPSDIEIKANVKA